MGMVLFPDFGWAFFRKEIAALFEAAGAAGPLSITLWERVTICCGLSGRVG